MTRNTATRLEQHQKDKIIHLKVLGYSVKEISKIIPCSTDTVSRYTNPTVKEKANAKQRQENSGFGRKAKRYMYNSHRPKSVYKQIIKIDGWIRFRERVKDFKMGIRKRQSNSNHNKNYSLLDLYQKFWKDIDYRIKKPNFLVGQAICQWSGKLLYTKDDKPIMYPYHQCKYSGRIINVENPENVNPKELCHIDHSDGDRTNNSLQNAAVSTGLANVMKTNLSISDFKNEMNLILKHINKMEKL